MVTFIADLILGGLLSLALFVLGLFPSINPDDFIFSAPEGVRDALGALNWFVPYFRSYGNFRRVARPRPRC